MATIAHDHTTTDLNGTPRGGGFYPISYYRFTEDLMLRQMSTATLGGTVTRTNNNEVEFLVNAASGNYALMQSKRCHSSSDGSGIRLEFSTRNFNSVSGVTKEVGLVSSVFSAPYTDELDGVRLFNDGSALRLQAFRFGTSVLDIPMSGWSNAAAAASVNMGNAINLWRLEVSWSGGGSIRVSAIINGAWVVLHHYNGFGVLNDVLCRNFSKPLRWGIRSTGGSGDFYIQSAMVLVDGRQTEFIGEPFTAMTTPGTPVVVNAGNTIALLGVRKRLSMANVESLLESVSVVTNNTSCVVRLILNPFVLGTFTYNDLADSPIQFAIGTASNQAVGGIVLENQHITNNSRGIWYPSKAIGFGVGMNGTQDTLVLCATPVTGNHNIHAIMNLRKVL
jgi:hypothetical protein